MNEPKDITVKLPRQLDAHVKEFMKTQKGMRYNNPTDFYREAARRLLDHYETKREIIYLGRDEFENIILNDIALGHLVTLRISKNTNGNILICNTCLENCRHRDFVLQQESLWNYLKEKDVKIKKVRDNH